MLIVEKTSTGNFKLGEYKQDYTAVPTVVNRGQLTTILFIFEQYKLNTLSIGYSYCFFDLYNSLVVIKLTLDNKLLFGVVLDDANFQTNPSFLDGKNISDMLERIKQIW